MVMGTASTMAAMAEALGMALPGNAAIPRRRLAALALAEMAGRRIVEMVREDLKPSQILTARGLRQRDPRRMAIGGSTNAIIHLLAIAGRARRPTCRSTRSTSFADDAVAASTCGRPGKYLMEDFFYAGGLPAVLKELLPLLHLDAPP